MKAVTIKIDMRVQVYLNWDRSITKEWSTRKALLLLRDTSVEQLVEDLARDLIDVKVAAVVELVEHGCLRKAADLARQLEAQDRRIKHKLMDGAEISFVNYLLKTPLEAIPGKPSEYHRNAKRMYLL